MAATVIYEQNFNSLTLANKPNPYLGGWYGSPVAFGEWVRSGTSVTVTGGTAQVSSDSNFRSAAVFLAPNLFPSAGQYRLTVELLSFAGDAVKDTATVGVWKGSGYDLTNSSANALVLNTQSGAVQALGTAVASSLGVATISTPGTTTRTMQIDFTHDGTSAIAIFLGVTNTDWPFPTATYDNLQITQVPEAGTLSAVALAGLLGVLRRRRR